MNEWENWIKKYWIAPRHTERNRLLFIHVIRAALIHMHTRTHCVLRRCTFTGVVLVSNCNRSRFSVRMFAISNQNFATSKRIYICAYTHVSVLAVHSIRCDVMYGVNWDAVCVMMKNKNKWNWAEDEQWEKQIYLQPYAWVSELVAPFFRLFCVPSFVRFHSLTRFSFNVPVYIVSQLIGNSFSRANTHSLIQRHMERNNNVFL